MGLLTSLKLALFGHVVPPKEDMPLIITAKVTAVSPHPNADRLKIVSVYTGSITISPVVCGATNFKEGDIVVLALPGATIPHNIHSEEHEPFVLQKAAIRGVESQGMLCSGFELGLRDTPETREEGILVLREGTRPGQDVYKLK